MLNVLPRQSTRVNENEHAFGKPRPLRLQTRAMNVAPAKAATPKAREKNENNSFIFRYI